MAQLVFMDGSQMGSGVVLQSRTTLGRHADNGIPLDHPSVLARHAQVVRKGGIWTIERVTPMARVAVNGKEVAEQALAHGDVLSLGDMTLLFSDEQPETTVTSLEHDHTSVITRKPHVERAEDAVTNIRRGRRAKEHLETLYKVGADINATLRLSDLSQSLFTHLTEAFKPDRSFLLLCDAAGRLVVRDERMTEASRQGSNKLSKTILAEAVGRREAIRVENALNDPRYSDGESIRKMHIQSALCAPLVKGSRVLGALLMDIVTPRAPWNDEDLQLIDAIAAQTATAVETLQQLEREVQFGRLLMRLGESARKLTSSLSADIVLKEAVEQACLIFECARASVLLADPKGTHLSIAASNCIDPKIWPGVRILPGEGFAGKAFQDGRPILVHDATNGERSYETSSFVVTPLFGGDAKPIGVLTVTDKRDRAPFSERDQELLDIFASQVGIALTNARLYERATTDALTRLCNRANFDIRLDEAVAVHHASKQPLSLIMCDLDHFKSKNDTYGHQAGDHILTEAAAILKSKVGTKGLAGRYGGEEFIVFLPGLLPARAKEIAEEVRRGIEEFVFNTADQPVRCTMSLGISGLQPGEGPGGLIKRADAVLYTAKHGGRNRVEVAP
ncbi:MAG TPA: diguanylate cyclase [Planctomycetota bacterium]